MIGWLNRPAQKPPPTLGALTAAQEAMTRMPPVMTQFPLCHANGAQHTRVTGQCLTCAHPILDADFRGSVAAQSPHVFAILAVGYCHPCQHWTPFVFRLRDDNSIEAPHPKTRRWERWGPRSPWQARFARWWRMPQW